jgi:hypothetical protein
MIVEAVEVPYDVEVRYSDGDSLPLRWANSMKYNVLLGELHTFTRGVTVLQRIPVENEFRHFGAYCPPYIPGRDRWHQASPNSVAALQHQIFCLVRPMGSAILSTRVGPESDCAARWR